MKRPFDWIKGHAIILTFSIAKLILHVATATHYGLQRDAYLYLAQSRHLDWGYFSTPPLLAFLLRLHSSIVGDSTLALRLLPALISTICLFLTGRLIKQLGGKTWAQTLGLSAYLLAPAFLRPGVMVQPVILNHLFWLLGAMVVLRMVQKHDSRQLLWMIPVLGLGWLNKYSIVFYGFALFAALLVSPHRKLLWSKYLPLTMAGVLLFMMPNLLWQYQHNWPVLQHASELQSTQLIHVSLGDFLMSQVFMALCALTLWMGGLIYLLFSPQARTYRLFGWAYLITLLLIILLRGKFYYTIGAYTILVVFGALAWERWGRKPRRFLLLLILSMNLNIGITILPFSLPVYAPGRMVEYDRKMMERGLDMMLTWEDGVVHALPQDYADMLGWDELGAKVWDFYEELPDSIRARTWVYGENYGMAGSINHFCPNAGYPQAHSFNDAFMEWIPREPDFDHLLYVGWLDRVPQYFDSLQLVGRVENPHFREHGLPIWFGSGPTGKLHADWEKSWQESAGKYRR